jgi:hypothetical protein
MIGTLKRNSHAVCAFWQRPSDDSFKRVASRPFSPPSSQLFRSKKDPSTGRLFHQAYGSQRRLLRRIERIGSAINIPMS